MSGQKAGDREILLELRRLAAGLGETEQDELLHGQFDHLRARIEALIEIMDTTNGQ